MARPKPIKNLTMNSALIGALFIPKKLGRFKKIVAGTMRGRPLAYMHARRAAAGMGAVGKSLGDGMPLKGEDAR